jgi:hypothetical protein
LHEFYVQAHKNTSWQLHGIPLEAVNCTSGNHVAVINIHEFIDWIMCESKCGKYSKCVTIQSKITCQCDKGYKMNSEGVCKPGEVHKLI